MNSTSEVDSNHLGTEYWSFLKGNVFGREWVVVKVELLRSKEAIENRFVNQ